MRGAKQCKHTASQISRIITGMDYIFQALQLAQLAIPLSSPNPRVGCVIVSPQGCIIGRGFTQPRGQAHAEVMALQDVAQNGASAKGSTVYVTLEPCSHYGSTPPCCNALIEAGVAKVVIALTDPNPQVAGRGIARLREAGIQVEMASAEAAQAAQDINRGFLHRMKHNLPWVRLKTATSLDGIVALNNGQSQWITGGQARADVQNWRLRANAVLTGIGTILHDNPSLNIRLPHVYKQIPLFIVDSHLRTPPTAKLFSVPDRSVCICTVEQAKAADAAEYQQRAQALQAAGAEVLVLPATAEGQVNIQSLLSILAQREINELHVEAGGKLSGYLLQNGLVNEVLAYIAPMFLGVGQPFAVLPALTSMSQAQRWHTASVKQLGNDMRWRLLQAS